MIKLFSFKLEAVIANLETDPVPLSAGQAS